MQCLHNSASALHGLQQLKEAEPGRMHLRSTFLFTPELFVCCSDEVGP
uniref:Uncharacterized protein n=2 Tax=Anguilla anguilla TaxID=7936 RepID=A0A0E9UTW6_ANGAN